MIKDLDIIKHLCILLFLLILDIIFANHFSGPCGAISPVCVHLRVCL